MTQEPESNESGDEPGAAEAAPPEEAATPPTAATPEPAAKPAVQDAAADEPALHPKERRRRSRSRHQGEARPGRSHEERQAERAEQRRQRAERRRAYRVRARAKASERRAAAGPPEPPPAAEPAVGRPKVRQGVVVSDKAEKTITVRIDVTRRHRMYGKVVRSSATLHAHDESNDAHVGDTVRIVESRPLSRTKRWRLVEVLERAR